MLKFRVDRRIMCNGFCPSKYNISRVSMGSLPGEVCHYSTVKHGKTQAAKID